MADKALTALKASDFDTAAMYFDTDIGASIGKNTADNENSNEIHNEDINNQIIQILMDNLQYTIVSSEENDDTAVVTVKIKNINMADVMQDYLSEALNYVFSDISADELETKLNELLISSMDKNTENIIVTAQHMDPLTPGRGMGHVLGESLKEAGAEAVFLNHAEHSLTISQLSATINRAKELGLIVIACADSVAEAVAISKLNPEILLAEPTELIGTGTVADDSYMVETIQKLHEANPDVLVMIASGVSTADDVYHILKLGADGTGATSGILNAPSPAGRIQEWADAVIKLQNEQREGKQYEII